MNGREKTKEELTAEPGEGRGGYSEGRQGYSSPSERGHGDGLSH